MKQARTNSVDSIKAIAAILVVVQHALGSGEVMSLILTLARVAVPLFMIITGFFYSSVVKRKKQGKQIKKFVVIALTMTLIYFVLDFLTAVLKHDTVNFLSSMLSFDSVFRFVVFQDPVFADHAWYMWSMIIVLALVWLIPIIYKNKILHYPIIIAGALSTVIFGKYSIAFFGTDIPSFYTRTAWSVGFPYFLLESLLASIKKSLLKSVI